MELALARTASHLERIVRAYRRVQRPEEVEQANRIHDERFLQWYHDEDGSMVLRARLTPEQGVLVIAALREAAETEHDVSAETSERRSRAQRNADALAAMAESFLASGPTSGAGSDRHLVTVHVDAEVLTGDGDGRCELEEGPALAAETARRLGCDAAVVGIVEDEHGTPLDVGRKTRTISPSLRRALRSRDQGCRFPGCTNTRYVDGHHVQHWAQGGVTSLANLVTLCRAHHRSVHEGGYAIRRTNDGAAPWAFLRPDGTEVPAVPAPPPPTDAAAIPRLNDDRGIDIAPGTIPAWCGERLDLGMAVDGLYLQDHGLARPGDVDEAPSCQGVVAPGGRSRDRRAVAARCGGAAPAQ
ncbi:MAG: HNH endonuclease [Actinobacteria bacterium]|nr:HNH endonuclease [Actinomycetota bacterium]